MGTTAAHSMHTHAQCTSTGPGHLPTYQGWATQSGANNWGQGPGAAPWLLAGCWALSLLLPQVQLAQ